MPSVVRCGAYAVSVTVGEVNHTCEPYLECARPIGGPPLDPPHDGQPHDGPSHDGQPAEGPPLVESRSSGTPSSAPRQRYSSPRSSAPRLSRSPAVSGSARLLGVGSPAVRLRGAVLNLVVAASVAGPVSAAARPQAVPAPVPASIAPLRALPQDLDARYAVAREGVLAAERLAGRRDDLWRAARLREMAVPGRRFLFFDGRDGGRAAEVFGDLATARRIAIVVPGSDTNLDKYGHLHGGALRLHAELGERSAVIAWLGYRTPATTSLGALTPELAETGARDLRTFVRELRAATPGARISLLCHSYGAAVCGRAAPGLDVSAIVFAGAPGAAVDDAAELRTRRRSGPGAAPGTGSPMSRTPASACPSRRSGSGPIRCPRRSAPGSSRPATAATATT